MKRKLLALTTALVLVIASLLPVLAAEDDSWMQEEAQLYHITDMVGLLSEAEKQELEQRAKNISLNHGLGIYLVVVDNCRDYVSEDAYDSFDAAVEIYKEYSLGLGEGKDGLLLLLSMDDREYSLITYGDFGNYAFNDEGRSGMTEFFLDDFADDDWYAGFSDYLEWSGRYLEAAQDGSPYSDSNIPMTASQRSGAIALRVGVILLVPALIAGVVILVLSSKMKSVAKAVEADAYVSEGGLELFEKWDLYTYTSETRRKKEQDSGSKSGNRSSGGFSGTSGKF